jgi:GNAT superfamily N-acetyltransferase
MTLSIRSLRHESLDEVLDGVAQLRISVFRAWPYLYDGNLDYERKYIQTYRDCESAIVVGAFAGDELVGAATGTPMEDHAEEFAGAFDSTGIPLEQIFYCAESVLLPEYRGRGIGHRFFDEREAHARRLGRRFSAFCGVIRPPDHPRRPENTRSLEPFWRKRGYEPLPGVLAHFSWKDVDDESSSEKPLQFWMRKLT